MARLLIAHLSDPHLSAAFRLSEVLAPKRLVGTANLLFNRHSSRNRHVLSALSSDVRRLRPDLLVITGDLTNLSLPQEFDAASRWIEEDLRLPPAKVLIVPGNHDRYIAQASEAMLLERSLGTYLDPNDQGPLRSTHVRPPITRTLDGCMVIGMDSSIPMPPFVSGGHIASEQLRALRQLLTDAKMRNMLPIIALHHAPLESRGRAATWFRGLREADYFLQALDAGPALILHGHLHRRITNRATKAPIVSIGAASCSMGSPHGPTSPGYNQYEIDTDNRTVRASARVILGDGLSVSTVHPWGQSPFDLRNTQ